WSDEFCRECLRDRVVNAPCDQITHELCTLRVVADVTDKVGRVIPYPFYVLCMLVISRASFFDYLNMPPALLILWGGTICILLYLAMDLGRKANDARDRILRRLNAQSLEAGSGGANADRLKAVMEMIRAERDGAFKPFVESPLFLAISIPLGG